MPSNPFRSKRERSLAPPPVPAGTKFDSLDGSPRAPRAAEQTPEQKAGAQAHVILATAGFDARLNAFEAEKSARADALAARDAAILARLARKPSVG